MSKGKPLKINRAMFEMMWRNPTISNATIADAMGIDSHQSVSRVGKRYDLPARKSGPKAMAGAQT